MSQHVVEGFTHRAGIPGTTAQIATPIVWNVRRWLEIQRCADIAPP